MTNNMHKVLVAEDDAIARMIISKIIRGCGAVPIEASCGRRAWEVLVDNPDIAMLITDMAMPEMDGRQLITAVRNHPKCKNIPIIIVSGQVKLSEINDLLILGASRFMAKPLRINDLREYVNYFLSLLGPSTESDEISVHFEQSI